MRALYLLLIFSIFINCNSSINKKEEIKISQTEVSSDSLKNVTFYNTLKNVIKFYNEKNETELNKLIHPKKGIYYLFRIGAPNVWVNKKNVCLSEDCKEDDSFGLQYWHKNMLRKQVIEKDYSVKYENYPKFCFGDNQEASKEGIFIDTLTTNRLLSKTITESIELFGKEKTKREVKIANLLENESRRIVLSNNTESFYGGHFIFHLTYIEGGWYLTLIDLITTDCSV